MWLSRYEKHNVLSFIRRNSLKQFTTNELIRKITKEKYVWYGYGESNIEKHLHQLAIENELTVHYISQNNRTIAVYEVNNRR